MRLVEDKRAMLVAITPNNAIDEEWHKREGDEDKWMTMRRYVEWSAEIMRIQNNQSMYFM